MTSSIKLTKNSAHFGRQLCVHHGAFFGGSRLSFASAFFPALRYREFSTPIIRICAELSARLGRPNGVCMLKHVFREDLREKTRRQDRDRVKTRKKEKIRIKIQDGMYDVDKTQIFVIVSSGEKKREWQTLRENRQSKFRCEIRNASCVCFKGERKKKSASICTGGALVEV